MVRTTGFLALVLVACEPGPADPSPGTVGGPPRVAVGRTVADPSLRGEPLARGPDRRPALAASSPVPRLPPDSPARTLLNPLVDLEVVPGLGADLVAKVEALPPERRAMGLAGLPYEEYLVDPAYLCETATYRRVFEEDGATWDLGVFAPAFTWVVEPPTPDVGPLPEACADALALEGGVDGALGAGCTREDEATFFPPGSTCRACVDVDGDHDRCVEEAICQPESWARMQRRSLVDGGTRWFYVTRASVIACAPDYTIDIALLSRHPYDVLPTYEPAFEMQCFATWDVAEDAPTWACLDAQLVGHTVGDTLWGSTAWLRPEGSTEETVYGRAFMASGASFEGGREAGWFLAFDGALGSVTTPVDEPLGWGFDPRRTDGPSPDLEARKYVAAMTLKTSSEIDGIVVSTFDGNRCEPDAWTDLGDGTARCDAVGPWPTDWRADGLVSWWDEAEGSTYVFPFVTLVSTGVPDPAFPGGVLPRILGSTTLADEGWEGCAWPETFAPDRMPLADPEPAPGSPTRATFDGQTYRFGRDDDPGVVLGLATSQKRDFCFEPHRRGE